MIEKLSSKMSKREREILMRNDLLDYLDNLSSLFLGVFKLSLSVMSVGEEIIPLWS